MALHAGGVIQDQNWNIHCNDTSAGWKTNVSKAPRKGALGGRTPLGDLSNSLKPSLIQTSKKQNSNTFSHAEKETWGASNASKKKSIPKASEKLKTGGRKALSDISNSGKPHLKEASKKNCSAKPSVAAEDPIHLDAIAEEGFLHNHQECIKAQTRAMDVDQFLKTIGLENDFHKQLAVSSSATLEVEPQSPLGHLELEEMTELLIEEQPWNLKLPSHLDSSPPWRTPISPKPYTEWKDIDYDCINFKLIDSPESLKH